MVDPLRAADPRVSPSQPRPALGRRQEQGEPMRGCTVLKVLAILAWASADRGAGGLPIVISP